MRLGRTAKVLAKCKLNTTEENCGNRLGRHGHPGVLYANSSKDLYGKASSLQAVSSLPLNEGNAVIWGW